MTYSDQLPDDVQERLMRSVEARDARQREKRAQIPVIIGRAILGRSRPDAVLSIMDIRKIPAEHVRQLGRRLQNHPILRDEITKQRNEPSADEHLYQRYVSAGNRHNGRLAVTSEERAAKRQAMMRQTQNVADELHHFAWFQLQLARTSRAALRNVRFAAGDALSINESDGLYAASAIEDFGHCLGDHPALQGITMGRLLPNEIRRIGIRASIEPNTLRLQHNDFFRLQIHEQTKRVNYWGNLLDAYEEFGGIRRTEQDLLDQTWVDEYARDNYSFGPHQ